MLKHLHEIQGLKTNFCLNVEVNSPCKKLVEEGLSERAVGIFTIHTRHNSNQAKKKCWRLFWLRADRRPLLCHVCDKCQHSCNFLFTQNMDFFTTYFKVYLFQNIDPITKGCCDKASKQMLFSGRHVCDKCQLSGTRGNARHWNFSLA